MAEVVSERIVVSADPDTVLETVADFDAYPQWQPEVKAVEILETDDDGWGTKVRFEIDAKVTKAWMVLDYTYTDTEMRWTLDDGDQLKRNDGRYAMTDLGDGTTEVVYEVEIEPTISVPKMIRRHLAKRAADTAVKGLKRRVEGGS